MTKWGKLSIALIGFCLVFASIWLLSSDSWVYRTQFDQSHQLISEIEEFRLNENRFPNEQEVSLIKVELGLPIDERCPCYQLKDEEHFIIWFGYQSTGSSMVYDSQTTKWEPGH